MNNIDRDIEKMFAQKLEGMRTPVSERVWQQVQAASAAPEKRRLGWWFWAAVAGLLGASVAVLLWLTLQDEQAVYQARPNTTPLTLAIGDAAPAGPAVPFEPQRPSTHVTEQVTATPSKSTTMAGTRGSSLNKPVRSLQAPPTPRTTTSAEETAQVAPEVVPAIAPAPTASPATQPASQDDLPQEAPEKPVLPPSGMPTIPAAQPAPSSLASGALAAGDSTEATAASKVPDNTVFPPGAPLLASTDSSVADSNLAGLYPPITPKEAPEAVALPAARSAWFIEAFGGPSLVYRDLRSSVHTELVRHKNAQETEIVGFSAGVAVGRQVGRWQLGGGLLLTRKGEAYDFEAPTISHNTTNTYDYAGTMLFASYGFSLGHQVTLRPRVEVVPYVLLSGQASWLDPFTHNAVVKEQQVNDPYRSFALGSRASLEMDWAIAPGISLLVRPGYNRFLTSIYREREGLTQTPYSLDVDFGLRYRFPGKSRVQSPVSIP